VSPFSGFLLFICGSRTIIAAREELVMSTQTVRAVFAISGLYDFLIGLAFLLFGVQLFDATGVPQPLHWGYINFGALMLMIFGTMFMAIARDPLANRNLIPYGMMLKVSYCVVASYYWMTTGLPTLFKPFIFIDAAMLVLFWLAYNALAAPAIRTAE